MRGLTKIHSMVENPMDNSLALSEVALQETRRKIKTPQAVVKECRICLQGEQQSSKQLISPCKCTGSVRFIHSQCLKQWIEKSFKNSSTNDIQIGQQTIDCEMCKSQILYGLDMHRKLKTCEQFTKSVKNKRVMFTAIVIMLSIILSLTGFVIWFVLTRNLSFSQEKLAESLIIIAAVVVILLFFTIGAYFLIDEFCLGFKICVEVIKPKQQPLNKNFSSASLEIPSTLVIIEQLQ